MGVLKVSLLVILGLLIVTIEVTPKRHQKNYAKLLSNHRPGRSFPTARQEETDPCDSNPCNNCGYCCSGSYCELQEGQQFACHCNAPYAGPTCDQVCGITQCYDQLYDSIDDIWEEIYSNKCYNKKRSLRATNTLRRHLDGAEEDQYQVLCRPIANTFAECLAEVKSTGNHCACGDDEYYHLVEVMSVDGICGSVGECTDDNAKACSGLAQDIQSYLYSLPHYGTPYSNWGASNWDNWEASEWDNSEANEWADWEASDWDNWKASQWNNWVASEWTNWEANDGDNWRASDWDNWQASDWQAYFKRSTRGRRRVTDENQINETNVEDKINEFAQCAQLVDVDAAAEAGCHVVDLKNPQFTVLYMQAQLDGCDVEDIYWDCIHYNTSENPCDPAKAQEIEAQFVCITAALAEDDKCERIFNAADSIKDMLTAEVSERCAVVQEYEALKSTCTAPAKKTTAKKANLRRMGKTLLAKYAEKAELKKKEQIVKQAKKRKISNMMAKAMKKRAQNGKKVSRKQQRSHN